MYVGQEGDGYERAMPGGEMGACGARFVVLH